MQSAKVARYREFAKNFRQNENAVIDIDIRYVFPVGAESHEGSFIFNIDGFTIAPFRNDVSGQEAPIGVTEWFEWGNELYFGPKTFNRYEQYDAYKKYCTKNEIEIPDDDFREWDLTRHSEWQLEHLRAQQEMAFAMTFSNDEFGRVDIWMRPWVPRYLYQLKPLSEYRNTHVPYAFYGEWTIGEFETILRLAGQAIWHTEEHMTEEELEIPANIVIATNFERIADYLDQLDTGAFHEATKPYGPTERFERSW